MNIDNDIVLEPFFTEKDKQLFYKYLKNSKYYFEFGSGGSTYKAINTDYINIIYSTESDIEWYEKISKINKRNKKVIIKLIDLKCKPNNYGHPDKNSNKEDWIKYSNSIIDIGLENSKEIDFILIDGRFRVACCLKCHKMINDNCLIAFDDFLNREYYHVVLDYFEIIDKVDERMVILKKKKMEPNEELIRQYELNPL